MKISLMLFYTTISISMTIIFMYIINIYKQKYLTNHMIQHAIKASEMPDYNHALKIINNTLKLQPDNITAGILKADLLTHLQQTDQAINLYEIIRSYEPKNVKILLRLANLYQQSNQLVKSAKLYSEIIKLQKATASTYYNLAWALSHLGLLRNAIPFYKKVLTTKPNHAQAHYGLAQIYLAQGDYKNGWKEFEWRKQSPKDNRDFLAKQWDGISSPSGKRFLIRCEYGLGDTIQFIRYAKKIKKLGAYVIVEAQPALIPLLSLSKDIDKIVPMFKPLPSFDIQMRLMSLPKIFSPNESSIPSKIPYLHTKPELCKYWKSKLEHDKKIKIGLVWSGNKQYDHSLPPLSRRSINPKLLSPLLKLDNISFYSLQTPSINKKLPEKFHIKRFDKNFDVTHGRFMDTTAVIVNLDLIITIDTSIAHLAGALGKPVWLLIPYKPDWRWLINRTESPWYPTMRLFRQTKPGNWQDVIENVHEKLTKELIIQFPHKRRFI